MKILHTSDWHLGHEMYNYRRQDEFDAFFRQLTDIVAAEQPDALLVSGDVYHSSVPTVAAQSMYVESMLALHQACPAMEIIVTAGNHDSASRLEIDRLLWDHFHVHVVGTLERTHEGGDLDRHIFHIAGKGIVAAVPHVFKQNFPAAENPAADRQTAFFRALLDRVEKVNADGLPVVLMAHLAVAATLDAGEPYTIGGMDYSPLSALGTGFDYAALGHLHRPHQVPIDSTAVRYSGSPLAITFNEEYEHSVTIAEIHSGEAPQLRVIPIQPMRPVKTIPQQAVPLDEALEALAALPDNDSSYIRLNVCSADGLPPDCNERAVAAAKGKACRFCTFLLVDERLPSDRHQLEDVTPDELRAMDPMEVARKYLEGKGIPPAEYLEMMRETIEQLRMEDAE